MNPNDSALLAGLIEAIRDYSNPAVLLEVVAIAITLAIGFLLARWLLPRIDASPSHWRMGSGGLRRIAFPVLALLALLVGRAAFFKGKPTHLLDVAVPLLASLALIRLAIYVLRHIFPPNPLIKTFEKVIGWGIWSFLALIVFINLSVVMNYAKKTRSSEEQNANAFAQEYGLSSLDTNL